MTENCRALREKQKRFLKEQGLNPEEFLSLISSLVIMVIHLFINLRNKNLLISLGTAADYYKFYHIKKEKEVVIRR